MLGGGIGCSRLAVPLARALGRGRLTLVVNTADDLWRYGLRICPDLDTNVYRLSGIGDRERGWGVAGDTFETMDQLARLGLDPWFRLGDRDLAMHLARTSALAEGSTLSAFTRALAQRMDLGVDLIPMTDDEVATRVRTRTGVLGFQEWFVREEAAIPVDAVTYEGIEQARPAPGVLDAIAAADLVVLGPSNPVASVLSILGLPGVRESVAAQRCVAVTPTVGGVPITDEGERRRAASRAAMLSSMGVAHRASAVAALYAELIDAFVVDDADADEVDVIRDVLPGIDVLCAGTVIRDEATGDRLAAQLLKWTGSTPKVTENSRFSAHRDGAGS